MRTMLNQKKLQTNNPKGTFRRRDPHPTALGIFFLQWENGERWATAETIEKKGKRDLKWHHNNRDRSLASKRDYFQRNRESELRRTAKWYEENKEHRLEVSKKWAAENKDKKQASAAKRRAAKIEGSRHLSEEQKLEVESIYKQCGRMNEKLQMNAFEVDHTVPLTLGGLHEPRNLQIVPVSWNRKKNNTNSKHWEVPYGK